MVHADNLVDWFKLAQNISHEPGFQGNQAGNRVVSGSGLEFCFPGREGLGMRVVVLKIGGSSGPRYI